MTRPVTVLMSRPIEPEPVNAAPVTATLAASTRPHRQEYRGYQGQVAGDSPQVVLVQPPYLRAAGSHNDRLPLELCYLAGYLHRAGIEAPVLNADATGADCYIPWRELFANFGHVMAAADGDSMLFSETVERVMSCRPEVVVVAAADSVTPWVDVGNAYISAELSRRLRRLGVYTVGVGPFYTEVPGKFIDAFDAILRGGPSPSIVQLVRSRPVGAVVDGEPHDLSVLPHLKVEPAGTCRDDVVMTAFGCPFTCTFCLAASQRYRRVPVEAVAADVAARRPGLLDLGDAVLPLWPGRVGELAARLAPLGRAYTCEVSVTSITPPALDALQALGVVAVKMGVESGDDAQLEAMGKHQTRDDTLAAAKLIKERGLRLTAYVLLGGPTAIEGTAARTLSLCEEINADDYVINVWGHHDLAERDFRYDGHFSAHLVDQWGLGVWMPRFFALQEASQQGSKFALGPLISAGPDGS
ncbi:MAG: B12-binding domain-containing radical SAM protein [Mycobacteriales bacterium]